MNQHLKVFLLSLGHLCLALAFSVFISCKGTPPLESGIDNPKNGSTLSALPATITGWYDDASGDYTVTQVELTLMRYSDGRFWDGFSWGGTSSTYLTADFEDETWESTCILPTGADLADDVYAITCFVRATGDEPGRSLSIVTVGTPPPPIVANLQSWGSNSSGALGAGAVPDSNTPVPVFSRGVLEGKTITGLAGGDEFFLALGSEGHLYAWGKSTGLGRGMPGINSLVPVEVDRSGVLANQTIEAMAGDTHALAVNADGEVFSWGSNLNGELGIGAFPTGGSDVILYTPQAVVMTGALAAPPPANHKKVTAVAAGFHFSVALTAGGQVFSWGDNYNGQLGIGTGGPHTRSAVPVAVQGLGSNITAIAAGQNHTLALTRTGEVYSWGAWGEIEELWDYRGQLGTGSTTNGSRLPVLVGTGSPMAGKKIVAIAANGDHSLALDEDGILYSWGSSVSGQVGNGLSGADQYVFSPVVVTGGLAGKKTVGIATGNTFSYAVTDDNEVYAWGLNSSGQLCGATSMGENQIVTVPTLCNLGNALSQNRKLLNLAASDHAVTALTAFTPVLDPDIEVEAQSNVLAHGATVNFGSNAVGSTTPIYITVRNKGKAELANITGSIFGGNQFDFAPMVFSVPSLPPEHSTGFTVFFRPTSTGAKSTTLRISSNDPDETPVDLTLTGTGLPTGEVDPGFADPVILGGGVITTAVQADGMVLIGGDFTSVSGLTRNRLARLNSNGSLNTAFNPNVEGGNVNCIVVQTDGKIVIGGSFTSVGGTATRNHVARLDATTGALDPSFDPDEGATIATEVFGEVMSMALQTDGKIIVAGSFFEFGAAARDYLLRLETSGAADTGFNPDVSNMVRSVAVQPNGKIIIGGTFLSVGGYGHSRIARVEANGDVDNNFNASVSPGSVFSVAVQADGRVLVGGSFSSPRARIARFETDGTLDPGLDHAGNGTVSTMALQTNGRALIGGSFTTLDTYDRNHLARLDGLNDPGTMIDPYFDPDPDNVVSTVGLQADGQMLIGGYFTNITGAARNYIVRLTNENTSQNLTVPGLNIVYWNRDGGLPEASQVLFELSTDGGTVWTPLGAGERSPKGWVRYGLSLPVGGHIRATGIVPGGMNCGSSSIVRTVAAYGEPPEIAVTENGTPVSSGYTYDFGIVTAGTSLADVGFVIQNTGTGTLYQLNEATIEDDPFEDGNDASLFEILRPAASLASGATASLYVTYRPRTTGTHSVKLHIVSNDADENPIDVILKGFGGESIAYAKTQHGIAGKPDTDDTDGDGIADLVDIAIGADPNERNGDGTSVSLDGGGFGGFAPPPTGGSFYFHYQRNKFAMGDLVYQVEWSDTLEDADWHTTDVAEEVLSDDGSLQQVKATVPAGSSGRRFVRLKVTRP